MSRRHDTLFCQPHRHSPRLLTHLVCSSSGRHATHNPPNHPPNLPPRWAGATISVVGSPVRPHGRFYELWPATHLAAAGIANRVEERVPVRVVRVLAGQGFRRRVELTSGSRGGVTKQADERLLSWDGTRVSGRWQAQRRVEGNRNCAASYGGSADA